MVSLFNSGNILKGRLSTYTIVKELHRAADDGAVFLALCVIGLMLVSMIDEGFL
jgi:hypothetical protein